jgi:hypothetical protein
MPVLAVPVAILVIAGLFAICLLLAYEQGAKWVSYVVPSWHIPGLGSLRGWIQSHLRDGYNALAGYLDGYVHNLVAMVTHPVIFLRALFTMLTTTLASTHILLWAILNHTVPVAMSELRKFASATSALVQAQALSWYHLGLKYSSDLASYVLGAALAEVAHLRADALNWYHLGLKYTQDLGSYVLATALAEVAAAKADALRWSQQALTDAEQFAKAETTAALSGLTGALITDIEHSWPAVIAGIDGVIDVADGAFTDVVDDLRAIGRDLPDSLPGAIAATTAIAIPLLRLARDCTMPNCRNLSQVGRDLQSLFGALETGGLLTLLFEAARDPAGTARVVSDTLGPIVRESADLVRTEAA